MRKEVRDIYLYTLGMRENIKKLRKNKRGYDLFYKGNTIECQKIINFLKDIN